jgi:biopolymer transport protein TolR
MVTGINVTPLVDVTLVLLVIFMVTAKLISSQGIPLDLPRAASAGATQTVLAVSVTREGVISATGAPTPTDADLRRAAREALARSPELRTVIQASSGVAYGTVLHVMDELRETGITRIAFATDPAGGEPERR